MQPSVTEELEQEYQRFVEFGTLLDQRTRRYVVEYLRSLVSGVPYEGEELSGQYARYFRRALDELFATQDLLGLMGRNENINKQIVLDTLYWIRKTFTKVTAKHPHTDEVSRLDGWAVTPVKAFRTRFPYLLQYLKSTYPRQELDTDFYENRFRSFFDTEPDHWSAEQRERFELILSDLLAQWDALLQAKILAYQLQKLEEERQAYQELLENKVQEYRQLQSLISPFTDYLGWDMSRDLWQQTSFDFLKHYNDLLEDEQSLQELADLLGNLREAEVEIEEETFEKTIVRQEWKVDALSRAEIVGVHESKDLSHLLSSEAGLLSDTETEAVFLKRFADEQLMTLRYEDRRLVPSNHQVTEINQRVRQKEKGPFIVCVDTSQSMMGRPEQIAKVLCLGLLKMAMKSNRRAYLINFSTGIQTIDLYDIANSIDELAGFLRMSFYGGTDATLALYEALKQLKTHDYRDADVLMISDFIMYQIDQQVLNEVKFFQQNNNTEFHSLALSDEADSALLARFDTNWIYNPKQKGIIREMTRGLQTIGERL